MKRVIAAAVLLAVLACAAAVNTSVVARDATEMSRLADKLENLAAAGDWEGARRALSSLKTLWESRASVYGALMEQQLQHDIEAELTRACVAAGLESFDETAQSAAALRFLLAHMAEAEGLSWRAIL